MVGTRPVGWQRQHRGGDGYSVPGSRGDNREEGTPRLVLAPGRAPGGAASGSRGNTKAGQHRVVGGARVEATLAPGEGYAWWCIDREQMRRLDEGNAGVGQCQEALAVRRQGGSYAGAGFATWAWRLRGGAELGSGVDAKPGFGARSCNQE